MSKKGLLLMFLSAICFCIVQSLVKYIGPAMDSWAKAFFRGIFGLSALILWIVLTRKKIAFNNKKILFVRGFTGSIGLLLSFWTIDLLGLSMSNLYLYTYPVFAPVFSSLLYKEKFKFWKIGPIAMAFVGIFVIQGANLTHFNPAHMLGIISGISAGIAIASVRHLRKTDNPESISLVFISMAALVIGIGVFMNPFQNLNFRFSESIPMALPWILLILLGLGATGGQLLMTKAYRHLDIVSGSIISLLNVPMVALIAIFVFNESFDLNRIIGSLLIFCSAIWISIKQNSPDQIKS